MTDRRRSNATAANAEAIRSRLSATDDLLRSAQRNLTEALQLAGQDYEHNDEKLEQIVPLCRLLSSLAWQECMDWKTRTDARERRETPAAVRVSGTSGKETP